MIVSYEPAGEGHSERLRIGDTWFSITSEAQREAAKALHTVFNNREVDSGQAADQSQRP